MVDDALRTSASHVLLEPEAAADLDSDVIALSDDVEHHLRRVLRLRDGERVSVTDGVGCWRIAVVDQSSSGLALRAIGPVSERVAAPNFTLVTAIPKGDRVDWLVQKTVEVGVGRIVFVHAERSSVRWKPERARTQLARLQRIADESTRQSRRVWRTSIEGPRDALDVLPTAAVAEPGGAPLADDDTVAIGPEGGWTEAELACSTRCVSLGDNVLRVETAGVAATTLRMIQ